MSPIRDKEQLEEMRRRLYERGTETASDQSYKLPDRPSPVNTTWPSFERPEVRKDPDPRPAELIEPELTIGSMPVPAPKRRYSYRALILLFSMAAFLMVLIGTSLYLFLGTNQISSKNIGINVDGPLSIGGGEVLPLQVTVTNQNSVPIESAVLIVSFPPGTKSVEDNNRTIFEERVTLDRINAGEALNVPIKAVIFGEENQEHEIRVTIEYRLVDSNGNFFKEADPFRFKISSSPLVMRVQAVEKVSSGQEVDITITLQSNSPNVLRDILVSANYPQNFDYTRSDPSPVYRESEWLFKEIKPEESVTIKLTGMISGNQDEEFQMQFRAGTPRQDNQFILGSTLANANTDFVVEKPFVNVKLSVNGSNDQVVALRSGDAPRVAIDVTNTLRDTLYDMSVEVGISGNILDRESVQVSDGYYDSVKDVVRFEVSGDRTLSEITAGDKRHFEFSLDPREIRNSANFKVTANVFARRVNEAQAAEALIGTADKEVRYTSSVALARQISRNSSSFADTGPVPPVADMKTTYTITLQASAGGNDVTGGVVTTSIPQYASFENKTSGDGSIEFNPITKEITWNVGSIPADKIKEISFQVGIIPSQNQIGTVPAVLGSQRLRATDDFTDTTVRAEGLPLSATLSREAGYGEDSGQVVREVVESEDN